MNSAEELSILERELAWADPERVYLELVADSPTAVWLDGGPSATSGISVIGIPSRLVSVRDPGDALTTLATLLAAAPRIRARAEPTPLGWVGWIGYEVGSAELRTAAHHASSAAMVLGRLDRAVVFDHRTHRIRLLVMGDAIDDNRAATAWLDELALRVAEVSALPLVEAPPASGAPVDVAWRHSRDDYLDHIREAQRLISEGDVYQVCLCNAGVVAGAFDPVVVHRRLRRRSPTHHGALFRAGDLDLVCGSPEEFLTVDAGGHVVTRPMKGTRSRDKDPATDAALADELRDSDKEQAENLMIVDLMRNDLSRVSELGSVEVTELFGVEHYATVHQLVSTVESTLTAASSLVDLLRATLPPGSMTGAPKHSAMRAIDRIEAGPRGVFSGVFGLFSIDGTVDLAVVIRSIVISPDSASIGAGGGITALSVAEEEYDETMLKARNMLWALGVAS